MEEFTVKDKVAIAGVGEGAGVFLPRGSNGNDLEQSVMPGAGLEPARRLPSRGF